MLGLALLLASTIPGDQPPEIDLAFRTPAFVGWEGHGFEIIVEEGKEVSPTSNRITSRYALKDGRALLHAAVKIPPSVKEIHCFAGAVRTSAGSAEQSLDVLMYAAGKRLIPKRIQAPQGWMPVDHLQAPKKEQLQEYSWNVEALAGKTVRLALLDDDPRPGCYVICSGFQMVKDDRSIDRAFEKQSHQFEFEHHLKPLIRFESQHYLALSNTDNNFNELRLGNCELLYSSFMQHFRAKGFRPKEPTGKLHALIFQSQGSFCEYLGMKATPFITGIYTKSNNCLVTYDYATNPDFVAKKHKEEERIRAMGGVDERQQYMDKLTRRTDEFRRGQNISTIMHEAAHQMSFNTGILNRSGDVPVWVAEGLATYCEATRQGVWLGIGEPNPERLFALQKVIEGKKKFIPLVAIVGKDDWHSLKTGDATVLQGYGQSWALFRWLMEEKPAKMVEYLKVLATRSTSEHRLADFQQAFGRNLKTLQAQYEDYMKRQVARYQTVQR